MLISVPDKLAVPDKCLDEARQILAELTARNLGGRPYPRLFHPPARYCRAMAEYLLSTQAYPGKRNPWEPERTIRWAAYYLAAADFYQEGVSETRERLEALNHLALEFAF